MDFEPPPEHAEIRGAVRDLCARFPGEYWRVLEPDGYPEEFVAELTAKGWLSALIPEEYGGFGFARDYDVERKFRETRLYTIAPVSNNLVLAYLGQHVLDLPRSY